MDSLNSNDRMMRDSSISDGDLAEAMAKALSNSLDDNRMMLESSQNPNFDKARRKASHDEDEGEGGESRRGSKISFSNGDLAKTMAQTLSNSLDNSDNKDTFFVEARRQASHKEDSDEGREVGKTSFSDGDLAEAMAQALTNSLDNRDNTDTFVEARRQASHKEDSDEGGEVRNISFNDGDLAEATAQALQDSLDDDDNAVKREQLKAMAQALRNSLNADTFDKALRQASYKEDSGEGGEVRRVGKISFNDDDLAEAMAQALRNSLFDNNANLNSLADEEGNGGVDDSGDGSKEKGNDDDGSEERRRRQREQQEGDQRVKERFKEDMWRPQEAGEGARHALDALDERLRRKQEQEDGRRRDVRLRHEGGEEGCEPLQDVQSQREAAQDPPGGGSGRRKEDGAKGQQQQERDESEKRTTASGAVEFKNVLYYKHHHAAAAPTARGSLLLGKDTLSFRGEGHGVGWNLDAMVVSRYKGRIHPGVKVCFQKIVEDVESGTRRRTVEEEYHVFTGVDQKSFDAIRAAVAEARSRTNCRLGNGDSRGPEEGADGRPRQEKDESVKRGTTIGEVEFKKILYYRHHHAAASPTRGSLLLSKGTLSFRGQGHSVGWDLDAITVVRYQGRIHTGMKVCVHKTHEDVEMAWLKGRRQTHKEEYHVFTRVDQPTFDVIQVAVVEAHQLQSRDSPDVGT